MQFSSHRKLNCAYAHTHTQRTWGLFESWSRLHLQLVLQLLIVVCGKKIAASDACCASQKWEKKRLKANACSRVLSGSPQLPVQGKGRRQCKVFTFSHVKRRRCPTPQFSQDLNNEIVLMFILRFDFCGVLHCIHSMQSALLPSRRGLWLPQSGAPVLQGCHHRLFFPYVGSCSTLKLSVELSMCMNDCRSGLWVI